ncbi:MAG TPA: alpha/beta hydrolase [Steroidobacteraceae bacterium]|nr:alpha/beta hydrolase [Steroidobacteraceae bacterium]
MKYSIPAWTALALALHSIDASAALSECTLPEVTRAAKCGVIEVPEDPGKPAGRRIGVAVAVIPAEQPGSHDDPIVPLMGGPSEDAISAASYFVAQLGSLLRDRDLLLVDQRGTGKSGALRCKLYDPQNPAGSLKDLFPAEAASRCAKELSAHADLTQYTYPHFARDLEHVRRELGYGRLNLTSGSYGTRAAQVYVRLYPQSVRTVHLGSVVPLDVATPLTMAKSAETVRQEAFDACAADTACRTAFPNLRSEFDDVVRKLDEGVRVTIPGHTGTVPLDRGRVAEWFRSLTYRPYSSTELPWIVHRAHSGDWSPIAQGILANAQGGDSALSFGLFFSITCNDDIAYITEDDIARETRGTFLRDYRVRQQQGACKQWPKVATPTDRTPVKSSVPALFTSGASDGASPLWFVDRVTPGYSQRAEIVVGGQGHTEWSDCVGQLYERFVREGSVQNVRGAKCPAIPRPPFKTIASTAAPAGAACKQGAYGTADGDYVVVAAMPDANTPGYRYLFRDGRRGRTTDSAPEIACDASSVTISKSGGATEQWQEIPITTTDTSFSSLDTQLAGRLIEPSGPAPDERPLVVLVHGSERVAALNSIYGYSFAAQGITVFAYDKRGTGASAGEYTQNFELLAADAAAALAQARSMTRGRVSRAGYFGGSQGGWVAPLAATRSDAEFVAIGFGLVASPIEEDREQMISEARALGLDDKALALIDRLSAATAQLVLSGFTQGYEELARVRRELSQQPWSGKIHGEYSGQVASLSQDELRRLGRPLFDNVELIWDYDSVGALERVRAPVLWVLAGEDREAPIGTTRGALLQLKQAGKPIDVYLFPDTDHGMFEFVTNPDGSRRMTRITDGYLRLLGDWIKGHVSGTYGRAQKL